MHSLTRTFPLLGALLAVGVGTAAPVAAEPITLVSGTILYGRLNTATFNASSLAGPSIGADFGSLVTESWNPDYACFACVPGTPISLSQSESLGTSDETAAVSGSVLANGIDYWIESLAFDIDAGTFAVPDSTTAAATLTSPFAFRGVITARSESGERLTFNFAGSGSATATFLNNNWFATSYQFAAATPEPGTLLLIGGPAILAAMRRRSSTRAAG